MDYFGYLDDPESDLGRHYNSHLKTLDKLLDVRCLILLGEPGMGKTTTLSKSRPEIEADIQTRGANALWLDLHSYGDEGRLYRDMFESEGCEAWKHGSGEMDVFLDSYDECLIRIDTLSNLLADKFSQLPLDRLRLRIASRSAVWPSSFEKRIKALWGTDGFAMYELAPLRRRDVLEAATAAGLGNPQAFIHSIEEREVVPLAVKPITLNFLLNTYRSSGSLPHGQANLYREGCLLLADEVNPERRDSGLRGALSPSERMAVAGRIAAATLFGGRAAVWTGTDMGDVPPEDTKIGELSGSRVLVKGNPMPVSEAAINDALRCALFTSKGPQRVGWAHQSYAEFLAAWHLVEQGVSSRQCASLLYHTGDGRVVPQLYGTAGWLAVLNNDIVNQILSTDPDLLLSADIAALDETTRASTVEGLLAGFEAETIPGPHGIRWDYRKLAHGGLAAQLRPYIMDTTKPPRARYEAISMARMCKERGIQSALAEVALNPQEQLDIRIAAAGAVASYADADTRAVLKPLTVGLAEDKNDELKGCALKAVWPARMTGDELFAILSPPRRGLGFIGAYHTFIDRDLPSTLRAVDILPALRWIERALTDRAGEFPFDAIISRCFYMAWSNLQDPAVLHAFASALRTWQEARNNLALDLDKNLATELGQDDDKRRQLVELMVPQYANSGQAAMALLFRGPVLLFGRDVPWICERLIAPTDEQSKGTWAKLLSYLVDPTDVDNFGRIIETYRRSAALKAELSPSLEPVELGSAHAHALKAATEEAEARTKRPTEQGTVPPAQRRIDECLDRFESGQTEGWWQLNYQMLVNTSGYVAVYEDESDLTAMPGWKGISSETKLRTVRAARKYLEEADPGTNNWLASNEVYRPAWAGYRALRLLLNQQPDWCDQIGTETWRKWAPVILA
jgi:hypothetical protein